MPQEIDSLGGTEEAHNGVPPIFLSVGQPQNGSSVAGSSLVVEGIAFASAGLLEVTVEMGALRRKARHGLRREDMATAFPKIPALANAGFYCRLFHNSVVDATIGSADRQLLTVTARSRDGREVKRDVELKLEIAAAVVNQAETQQAPPDDPAMLLHMDQAAIDRKGVLSVTGWAISHSAIESVTVFSGTQLLGSAELGIPRQDVALAWPGFANALNSGFAFVADGSHLTLPENPITVVAKAVGGVTREATALVQSPSHLAPRKESETVEFYCDSAIMTSLGELSLSGWAVAAAGVTRISVLFEGKSLGDADYGHERPDVGNKFPLIAASRNPGFSFNALIDKSKLKSEHIISIEIEVGDGTIHKAKVSVATTEAAGPSTLSAVSDILLNIDQPQILNGSAIRKVDGTLSITGWAVAREGIASIELDLDEHPVGKAYLGIRREDVAQVYPDHKNSLLSGFSFSLPQRVLVQGRHRVGLRVLTELKRETVSHFEIDVAEIAERFGPWSLRTILPIAEQSLIRQVAAQLRFAAGFLIWVDCRNSTAKSLPATLRSITSQLYDSWSVIVTGPPRTRASIDTLIREDFPGLTSRLTVFPDSGEADAILKNARNRDLILPLDAGDILAADALFEFACERNTNDTTDFLYGDERRSNPATDRVEAFFKPDWSPTLLLSSNYIGRPWCATVELLRRTTLRPFSHGAAGNFGLVLKLTELALNVAHVQRVLAERNPTAIEPTKGEVLALRNSLRRQHLDWSVEDGLVQGTYRCRPKSKIDDLVSIIIPTCAAGGLIRTCIETLRNSSTYKNIEIICVDNILDETSEWKSWLRANCDVVVEILGAFNWSRFNNIAAREASGRYLLFLNDDIEIIQPDWLEAMLDHAARDTVAVVGPQLLYPDRKVQHAGMFLAGRGIARHSFRFSQEDEPGYFGLALTQRDVIAVTGACMLVKTEIFESLGGFDEAHSVINNDLDFCLRVRHRKLQCVYTPFARLIHHELVSRKDLKDQHDSSAFQAQWGNLFAIGDPYYHPRLETDGDNYQINSEPSQIIFSGHPLYRKEAIKRILAVKLDHIGDFVTAFPAFRRIKALFPQAELVALVAPASLALAKLEPSIDRVIGFEFFHARSQLGTKELDQTALAKLRQELAAYRFDLAIDLRLHPDTREILRCAGSRYTAGFDYRNQYSWLDVALPWEGDVQLAHKHLHISDQLANLVEAVGTAGIQERSVIKRPADWSAQQLPVISRLTAMGLFKRRLICLHPATGNEMRQWPPHRFAELINALLALEDVDVSLIGGPDELELSNQVLGYLPTIDRVYNLVGTLKLHELIYVFDACALFVGNNSGPKHMAAAIGTPTIGIHSGVVDAVEWGPLGDFAVAVQRNMSCGPCYLATRDQCHRGLACLEDLDTSIIVSLSRKLLKLNRGIKILP